jgi:hypothetical protein
MLVIVTQFLEFKCTVVQYGVGLTLKIAIYKIILKIWYLRGPQRSVKTCTFWFKSDQTYGLLHCLRGLSRHSLSIYETEDLGTNYVAEERNIFYVEEIPPINVLQICRAYRSISPQQLTARRSASDQ